jgi:succinylglutamic semialdehyde dehydrogenase
VLAVLGPFNFPGHLVNGHVIPALASGNTCVIKPSEYAPAVGQLYADLCHRAGLPAGVVNLIQGGGAAGAALAEHPGVDGVLFTGSWRVGRAILEATLDQPQKIVALEMGGNNAALVCDDADIAAAARAIAFAACVTAGQRCTATRRVLVTPGVSRALTDALVRLFREVRIGGPFAEDVFSGPVISAAARERHAQLLRWAADDGAERLVDGGPCEGPARGHWVRPTLHRVTRRLGDSRYQREEHFVPDVWIHEVDSLEAGIAAIDDSDYGLVASVFSAERETYERVYRETRIGLLNWNLTTVGASSRLPFGGTRRSGNDRPAGATSTLYCTYPVGSLEAEAPPAQSWPGFPEST